MTIGKKLMLAAGAMFLLSATLGYTGFSSNGKFKDSFDATVDKTVRKMVLADGIVAANAGMISCQRGVILAGFAKDRAQAEKYQAEFQPGLAQIRNSLAEMQPMTTSEEAKKLLAEIGSLEAEWQAPFQEVVTQVQAGKPEEANRIRTDITAPIYTRITAAGQRLAAIENEVLREDQASAAAEFTRQRWITILVLMLTLAAAGAFAATIHGTTSALRGTARDLLSGAEQVAGAAAQITASSQSLAQGSSEQAASLEEISSSSTEINSMASKNGENSRVAAERVAQSGARVVETSQSLDQMVVAMGEISAHSEKISKIIRVIDEIAFQTNILALNAAVEAARAGEAGMGFAVVADEVRNLAQRSAQAARDTAALIEEQVSKSSGGKARVDQVAVAIHAITAESAQVKQLVEEVSLGSQEQARGIEQVSQAITQMERITQQNAASAEQSASSAEELSAQASALKDLAGRLASLVGDTGMATGEAPARLAPVMAKPGARLTAAAKAREAFPMEDKFEEF